jgi:hypothetical protein
MLRKSVKLKDPFRNSLYILTRKTYKVGIRLLDIQIPETFNYSSTFSVQFWNGYDHSISSPVFEFCASLDHLIDKEIFCIKWPRLADH